jgi:uncharacterized integral membrane protein
MPPSGPNDAERPPEDRVATDARATSADTPGPAAAVSEPASSPTAAAGVPVDRSIARTRVGTAHVALVAGLLVLVLLLVFILENTRRVPVTFFGATGHLPLGVALLLAAVAGALILGVVGTVRIGQLRRRVRRSRR